MIDQELIARLLADETDLSDCAVNRIEELEKRCSLYARADRLFVEEINDLNAKLAKAVDALRVISQFNAVTNSHLNIYNIFKMTDRARAVLAELEGK